MSKNEFICDCNVIHQDVVDKITSEMLKDNILVPVNVTVTFNTLYEIDKNISKPYAIFYGEKDSKNTEGNSFYIYLK